MLRCYVSDHQRNWDDYFQVLTYEYNSGVHSSTEHTPFAFVLSITPTIPSIFGDEEETLQKSRKGKEYWVLKMASTVAHARVELKKVQFQYKKNFYRRLKRGKLG